MYFTKYMKDYLNYDGLAVMAHRGGSLEAPENTIESFKYSLEIGSDIIETDIQLSSDGVPYIFHDDDLKRILGIHKNFNELLSSEIDELNIEIEHNLKKAGAKIVCRISSISNQGVSNLLRKVSEIIINNDKSNFI